MPARRCLDCGDITTVGSRCRFCTRVRERLTRRRDLDDPSARWHRRRVLAAWRRQWGDLCPGWQRKPHLAGGRLNPLTVDHRVPVAAGGSHDRANLAVLCRQCNGRKGDR